MVNEKRQPIKYLTGYRRAEKGGNFFREDIKTKNHPCISILNLGCPDLLRSTASVHRNVVSK